MTTGATRKPSAKGVTELACLAHCRRRFFDLHAAGGHPVAEEALRRIAELYAIEAQARDGGLRHGKSFVRRKRDRA